MPLFSKGTLPRTGFSAVGQREAFRRLGVERKEKNKKREKQPRAFFPRADTPCWSLGFFQLLGANKSCFKGQSLNFMCT
jgi:hypothetical protein